MVAAIQVEQKGKQHYGAAGELSFPVLSDCQGEGVSQGGSGGYGQQSVHPHPAPQTAAQAAEKYIRRQEHPQTQKTGGAPHLDGIAVQGGQPLEAQNGDQKLGQSGDTQQRQQHHPDPSVLQPAAEALCQLVRRGVGGRRLDTPVPAGLIRRRVIFPVGAGDQFLQTPDFLRIGFFRLFKHVIGVLVCLASQVFQKGGQYALFLGKLDDGTGIVGSGRRVILLGRLRLPVWGGILCILRDSLFLFFRFRTVSSGISAGEL